MRALKYPSKSTTALSLHSPHEYHVTPLNTPLANVREEKSTPHPPPWCLPICESGSTLQKKTQVIYPIAGAKKQAYNL